MADTRCDPNGWRSGRGYLLGAVVVLAIAATLRLQGLGDYSLWYDEALYANNSVGDFETFLDNTRRNNSSPILLPYLYHVLGDSVRDAYSIRLLPALFGIAAVGVLLALPLAGIPATVSVPAALWLALVPVQIHFSQEVREYSLASCVAALLLWTFAALAGRPSVAAVTLSAATLLLTPLCSYGPVLLGAALLGALLLVRLPSRRGVAFIDVLPLAAALGLGVIASYLLTARDQMGQLGVSRSGYLADFYPPRDAVAACLWLPKVLGLYASFATGSQVLAVGSGLALAAVVGLAIPSFRRRREAGNAGEAVCILAAVLLVGVSVTAAFMRVYPFGGIRQHLFAAPLIVTATAIAVHRLATSWRAPPVLAAALLSAAVVALVAPNVRAAYGKAEDIRPFIDTHLKDVDDQAVYIYHAAVPALRFHYPGRKFVLGDPGSKEPCSTVRDLVDRTRNNERWLLLSHVSSESVDAVLAGLAAAGWRCEDRYEAVGVWLCRLRRID